LGRGLNFAKLQAIEGMHGLTLCQSQTRNYRCVWDSGAANHRRRNGVLTGMSSEPIDAEVVTAATGRRAAVDADFNAYATEHYVHLVRTAWLLTDDWGLAEDLVQTTLVKCWSSWSNIQAHDPTAYVRRALMNTYFSWWRRTRSRREYATTDVEIHLAGTNDRYESVENADVLQALRGLPKKMRALVVLR
jgi:DNA-directed RNA polymerase specialized sigma24 family protein